MEGYFKGIVCLACLKDSLAEKGEATYNALKDKHTPVQWLSIPSPPTMAPHPTPVSEVDIAHAIKLFPCGSAGRLDDLRPQHLKNMLKRASIDSSAILFSSEPLQP